MQADALTATVALTLSIAGGSRPGTPSEDASRRLVAEARAIWARAHVDVRVVQRGDAAAHRPDVYVYFTGATPPASGRATGDALAWIVFIDGRPSNRIFVSCAAARGLLAKDQRVGAAFLALPPTGQDVMLGRVLGRALAHEIGHYLSASRDHTRSGLMRGKQSIAALATDDTAAYTVARGSAASWSQQRVADDCLLAQLLRHVPRWGPNDDGRLARR